MAEAQRATYLGVDQLRRLDHWCYSLRASFGTRVPHRAIYLVGSVLERPDFRDVDLRIMLTDKEMRFLPLNRLDLNMMLSRWGQEATGLPIDCQVQSPAVFDEHAGRPRNPRGWVTHTG